MFNIIAELVAFNPIVYFIGNSRFDATNTSKHFLID